MKKILGLLAMALFVASVATAATSTVNTGNTTSTSNTVATGSTTATGSTSADFKVAATATCQKKGLAGALLDECVKNEIAKNGSTLGNTVPSATGSTGTTSTTHP